MRTAKSLQEYLDLPWTIIRERRNDSGGYLVLKVKELPGFSVAEGDYDLEEEFWLALENHLESYLEAGKIPPIPRAAEAGSNL